MNYSWYIQVNINMRLMDTTKFGVNTLAFAAADH